MTMYRLCSTDGNAIGLCAEDLLDRRGLYRIVGLSSRSVRVDGVDRFGSTRSRMQCGAHRAGLPSNGRLSDMGDIRSYPITGQFPMNCRTALDCALPVF